MRRLLAAIVCAAAVLAVPAAAHAQKGPAIVVQSVVTSSYPTVAVRLMVPASIAGGGKTSFALEENGRQLQDVRARALSGDRPPLSIVLLVDTSGSMRGEPLAAAKRAAAAFAGSLQPGDEVAVVGFSTKPSVLSPFTSDRGRALAAVERLEASGETALYDALIAADTLALKSTSAQRSIVLLSDGGDTQSSSSLDSTLRFLKQGGVPVFALGLSSPEAAPDILVKIADQTRGRSLAVRDVATLSTVYEDVARQIQNQYEMTFTSAQPDTKDLELVIVATSGDRKASTYVVIPNPVFAAPASAASVLRVAGGDGSPRAVTIGVAGILLVVALVFAAVMLLSLFIVDSIVPGPNAMQQLAYYEQTGETANVIPGGLRARLIGVVGTVAQTRGLTGEVQQRLEAAGLPLRPVEYITGHAVFVVVAGFVTQLFTGSLGFTVLVIVTAAFGPLALLDFLAKRRKAAFARQLPDVLGLIAGSLRAGYGLMQAVDHLVREAAPPASVEFRRVQTEAKLGLRVEDALEKMARRMDSPDFEWAVSAINIQREVGGNLAEVLDIVARTIRERDALRRTIEGLTAEGRLSAVILVVLPFVVGSALYLMSPGYVGLLFASPAGWFMVILAVVLMVVGIVWLSRVSTIEV